MRLFTILFMGGLTAAATWIIGPLLLGLLVGFIENALGRMMTGGDLVMGMLFVSMAAFLGGFWGAFIYTVLPGRRPLEAGGLRKSEQGDITRVQSPNYSPWQAAFVGVFFLPFVFAFITIIVGGGMDPDLGLALFFWAVLIVAIAFFPIRILLQRQHGDFDIVIDKAKSEISLPAMHQRRTRLILPWSEIAAATVEEGWEGSGRGRRFRSYVCLTTRGARYTLAGFTRDSESAHAFREWLEHRLGLPPTSSPA